VQLRSGPNYLALLGLSPDVGAAPLFKRYTLTVRVDAAKAASMKRVEGSMHYATGSRSNSVSPTLGIGHFCELQGVRSEENLCEANSQIAGYSTWRY